ncbi:MAG: transcriptional regulator [Bacteroidota bacterium]
MKKILAILESTKLDNRVRLGIMSILVVNDWVEFKLLKEMLELSDGNLASHLKVLEKEKYIEIKKQFVGRKPQTTYKATELGKKAFEDHLNALEELIKRKDS